MEDHISSSHHTQFSLPLICLVPLLFSGCGGRGGITVPRTISVYLPVSTVNVTAGAKSVTIPIQIGSTSETALVSAVGLPAGGADDR